MLLKMLLNHIEVYYINDINNDIKDQVSFKGIPVAQAKPLKNSFVKKQSSFLSTPQDH